MDAAERWREVDRIFAGALERPVAERAAFLDACGGDPELRQEVERLLAADERIGTFLETPAGEALGAPVPWSDEGGRVGPYRLLRRIGSGGMGTVYLARRDEHYKRLVAVKVLRSDLESSEARHRFRAERQILARLEHPNIARLYDGGSAEDGRPYLVMELVEGLPVDRYCDRHRLTVDQRLDLFRRICAAVQYAHQHLLVHRDLKPGNILVTPEGEPKLLDFGIAQQLGPEDAGKATLSGLRAMTPLYASPEQVRGEAVTTASDVYSLGVLLHELLAGRSPYRVAGRGGPDLEAAVLEEEPEPPSRILFRPAEPSPESIAEVRCTRPAALARRLRGDLDQIVLRALRKDTESRYTSVALLSQDLENHLALRPVAARPKTVLYRTGKLVRRHRTAVVGAVLAALLGSGLLTSFVVQGRRVARERDKARYTLAFLTTTFKQADPYHSRGERLTAREMLDEGADRAIRELASQPDVQAALMDSIGEVALGLGRYDQAEPLLERALALRRKVFGPQSLEVAESLEHLGLLKQERSESTAAEALLRQSLALRRRLLGDGDLAVAKTLNELGSLLVDKMRIAEAEGLHQEALAIAHQVEGPVGPTVADSVLYLAKARKELGDLDAAERLFRQGLAIERRALGPEDPRLYRDQTTLGEILNDAGKYQAAEALLRQSLAVQQRILGREHPDVVTTLNDLGVVAQRLGRFVEAEVIDREVLQIARAQFGPTHWRVAIILGNLGATLVGQDKPEKIREGIPYYEQALAIRRQNLGDRDPLVAQIYLLLAGAHRQLHEPAQALPLAQKALGLLEQTEGPGHPHVAYALREVGTDYQYLGRCAEAEPYLRRSLDIRRKELAADNPEVAKAKTTLGDCLINLGRYAEADVLLREADAALSAQFPADDYRVAITRTLRARLERVRRGGPAVP
ncbi:MAG: eukaryotic-like serine/threonine-protein kinase [Acidobacteriota bacterium]|jgi:serine/threonine-protein kinase|nr:eukaryotic-like serine/threonine-protein kinase [Acidobacteriota bacterium]